MDAKQTLGERCRIIATDNNTTAPAIYCADAQYVVPKIYDPNYIDIILDICKNENVKAITTLIDPEIEILAANREKFLQNGIIPLCPMDEISAKCCFNKWEMFKYLKEKGIPTPLTFHNLDAFKAALKNGEISFPVFMKPICGSGSVGAHKVLNLEQLEKDWNSGEHDYIIQELMTEGDRDADIYVDTISHKPVAVFSKKKIETRIGGANKTISFKDENLFAFVEKVFKEFKFNGPLDMDVFIKDGEYLLSEINPRFGGAYLHAYGAGVDFFELIWNNINNIENQPIIGKYDEDILMMMYDNVVIRKKSDLVNDDFTTI